MGVRTANHQRVTGKQYFDDDVQFEGGTIEIGKSDSKLGFFGATAVVQSAAYSYTNFTSDRDIDCASSSNNALGDGLGTVVKDLIDLGILQGTVAA